MLFRKWLETRLTAPSVENSGQRRYADPKFEPPPPLQPVCGLDGVKRGTYGTETVKAGQTPTLSKGIPVGSPKKWETFANYLSYRTNLEETKVAANGKEK